MNIEVLFIVVLILVTLLGLFVVPRFLIKRALKQVLKIFRRQEATSINHARTIDELGLRPRGFVEGMLRTRDYKPYALDLLRQGKIVMATEDGRLYLSEERLSNSGLEKRTKSLF